MYNTDYNPWPPGRDPSQKTRIGYSSRSDEISWPLHGGYPSVMARLDDYADKTLHADVLNSYPFVDNSHNDGVVVMYGDGAAAWIDRNLLEEGPNNLNEIVLGYPTGNNPKMDNIWATIDARH